MSKDPIRLDVLIIGGGPAGTSAALTLINQTSLNVAIVESTNYDNFRVGESVSPSFLSLLRYLKVEDSFSEEIQIPSHGIENSWGNSSLRSRDFFFTGQGHGWNLDRTGFDKMLAGEVKNRNGHIFKETKVFGIKNDKHRWILKIKNKKGMISEILADFIVDASGKNAIFSRELGAKWTVLDHLTAITSVYQIADNKISSYTLLESTPYGWWYSTLIPNKRRVVVFMTDSDIAKKMKLQCIQNWEKALEETNYIKKTIKNAKKLITPQIFPAYSHLIKKLTNSNYVPAGDALASFDPLSSIGIGHSILSGIEAARIAHDTLELKGTLVSKLLEKEYKNFQQYLKNRKHFYGYERRWSKMTFWRRRQEETK